MEIHDRPIDRNPDYTFRPPSPEAMRQHVAVMEQYGAPGIYHERLRYLLGEWQVTARTWPQGPNAPAQESRGKATYRWLMEGRWLAQDFAGQMMGMEYHGFGLTGYDVFRQEYVGTWVDNLGTTLTVMRGGLNTTGKVMTLYGRSDDPAAGRLGKLTSYVTRIVDDRTHVLEINDLSFGSPVRMMEITYRRNA